MGTARADGHVKPHFTLDEQGGSDLHAYHVQPNRLRALRDGLRFSSALLDLLHPRMRVEKDHDRGLRRLASDPIDRLLPSGRVDQILVALTTALLDDLRREVQLAGRKFTLIFVPFKPHVLTGTPHNHPPVEALAAELLARASDYMNPSSAVGTCMHGRPVHPGGVPRGYRKRALIAAPCPQVRKEPIFDPQPRAPRYAWSRIPPSVDQDEIPLRTRHGPRARSPSVRTVSQRLRG